MYKEKIIGGIFWKFAERISSQLISFVVSVVLARILLPSQYGLIAMVNLFIIFANVLVVCGFSVSLIQKKDADELDFSTIFYCSFAVAFGMYLVLFALAPYIARIYDIPAITELVRVFSLSLFLSSFLSVQQAYVSRHLLFKKTFLATFWGTLFSGVIGIILACQGFGVWSLVAQSLCNTLANIVVLFFVIPWRPRLMFSFQRAKMLMGYGSKLLLSDFINTLVREMRRLLIGKFYAPADLAFYDRGNHIPNLVSTNIDASIKSVLFPVMSNNSDNREKVKQILRRTITLSSYLTYFFLTTLAVVAAPLVNVVLTEKWSNCVIYMQIICIAHMIGTVSTSNIEAMKAIGCSSEVLKLEVLKKPIFLAIVFVSVKISVLAIALTMPLYSIYALLLNMRPTKKLLDYGFWDQIKDLSPASILSLVMFAVVYPINYVEMCDLVKILVQSVLCVLIYLVLSSVFHLEAYNQIKKIISDYKSRFSGVKNEKV